MAEPRFDTLSFGFLTLFFLIYLSMPLIWNIRLKKKFSAFDVSLMLLNAGVYFGLSYSLLAEHIRGWSGYWTLFLGLLYLVLGLVVYRRYTGVSRLSLALLAIAAALVTTAIPMQLDGNWITIAWAAESVIVFYLGLKLNPGKVPLAGLLILAIAILSAIFQPFVMTGQEIWIFLNKSAVACLCVILAMGLILWLYHRDTSAGKDWNNPLMLGLQIAINLLVIFFLTLEIIAYFNYQWRVLNLADNAASMNRRDLVLSLVWGLHAALLIVLGFWRRLKGLRWFGLGFLVIVIAKVFFFDLSNLSTPNRIMSFVGLGVILLTISWLYNRYKHQLFRGDDHEKHDKI